MWESLSIHSLRKRSLPKLFLVFVYWILLSCSFKKRLYIMLLELVVVTHLTSIFRILETPEFFPLHYSLFSVWFYLFVSVDSSFFKLSELSIDARGGHTTQNKRNRGSVPSSYEWVAMAKATHSMLFPNHRITEPFRMEKTLRTIGSNKCWAFPWVSGLVWSHASNHGCSACRQLEQCFGSF